MNKVSVRRCREWWQQNCAQVSEEFLER